jgi:mannosyltransferase
LSTPSTSDSSALHASPAEIRPRYSRATIYSALPVVVISGIALGLRLHLLGLRSMWIDEAASYAIAAAGRREFLRIVTHRDMNMSAYYLMLRAWMVFGDSDAWIRLLSVIPGVLAIPVVYALGNKLWSAPAGWIAASLLALNAFAIRYSQEARSYSLFVLGAVVATYLFLWALERPSSGRWILYALVSGIGIYVHFFFVLLTLAHAISMLFLPFRSLRLRPMLAAAGVYLLLFAPVVIFISKVHLHRIAWLPPPSAASLRQFTNEFTGSGHAPLVLCYLVVCASAFWPTSRSTAGSAAHSSRFRLGLLTLWLMLPTVVALAVSWVWRPIFWPRFVILSVPALALLAAAGLASHGPIWRWCATSILLLLAAFGAHTYFLEGPDPVEDWRDATAYVIQNARPGDAAVFAERNERLAFSRYVPKSPTAAVLDVSHADFDYDTERSQALADAARSHPRIWIVDLKREQPMAALVQDPWHIVRQQEFPALLVTLCEHN